MGGDRKQPAQLQNNGHGLSPSVTVACDPP
jgi:hypothetical protein